MSSAAQFYSDRPESGLRLGDIITGFQATIANTHDPTRQPHCDLTIEVNRPKYLVVLTPCCSIENKYFALAPLSNIRSGFLQNPHFVEDLTRINRKVQPELSVPPASWSSFPPERKQKMIAEGTSFVSLECFIYAPHDLLEPYEVLLRAGTKQRVHSHMVDFKSIFRVNCNAIDRKKEVPAGLKVLELTVSTRAQLRDKLANYFGRAAEEDSAILANL